MGFEVSSSMRNGRVPSFGDTFWPAALWLEGQDEQMLSPVLHAFAKYDRPLHLTCRTGEVEDPLKTLWLCSENAQACTMKIFRNEAQRL